MLEIFEELSQYWSQRGLCEDQGVVGRTWWGKLQISSENL